MPWIVIIGWGFVFGSVALLLGALAGQHAWRLATGLTQPHRPAHFVADQAGSAACYALSAAFAAFLAAPWLFVPALRVFIP